MDFIGDSENEYEISGVALGIYRVSHRTRIMCVSVGVGAEMARVWCM